jgi:hypothetical protein
MLIRGKTILCLDKNNNYGYIDNVNLKIKSLNKIQQDGIKTQITELLFENCII